MTTLLAVISRPTASFVSGISLRLCRRCTCSLHSPIKSQEGENSHNKDLPSSNNIITNIHKVLNTSSQLLRDVSHYHFNGLGKAIRPNIVINVAKAFNYDSSPDQASDLTPEQTTIAMVAEMIHTASLVHDDIIDESLFRRGSPSVFSVWGQAKGAYTGDYILGAASVALSQLRHNRVMQTMSQILEDLVQGEFMQLGSKDNEDERFNHYIEKSYRKTASLLANSAKSAALLSNTSEEKVQMAFDYGRNVGISFQLIDDALDYLSNEKEMGKPTGADLKLGLATAPVLFASHEYPKLNTLIMRRFNRPGDVEEALQLVKKSSGLEQTKDLAFRYGQEAIKNIQGLRPSEHSDTLIDIVNRQLSRTS